MWYKRIFHGLFSIFALQTQPLWTALSLDVNFIICIEGSIFSQNWKVRAVTPKLEVPRIHCHEKQTYHVKVPRLNFLKLVKTLSNSSHTPSTILFFWASKCHIWHFSAISVTAHFRRQRVKEQRTIAQVHHSPLPPPIQKKCNSKCSTQCRHRMIWISSPWITGLS